VKHFYTPVLNEAIRETEQRTGKKAIIVCTPGFTVTPETPDKGFDMGEVERAMEKFADFGVTFLSYAHVDDRLHDRQMHPQAAPDGQDQ